MLESTIPSKGTRLKWLLALTCIATAAWVASIAGFIEAGQAVSFIEWADFEKWLFATYGATEMSAKHSHAIMNKAN